MSQTKAQLIDPVDGSLVNADINASAAIAGTKISPDFGSQNITTTGDLTVSGGDVTINGATCLLNFNDTNNNPDFRIQVESGNFLIEDATNSYADRFVIDAAGQIGIGTSDPDQMLHVHKASAGSIASDGNAVITMENSTHCILQMLSPNTVSGRIMFGDTEDANVGEIQYNHSNNNLNFTVAAVERMRIDSSGRVLLGTTTEGEANADDLTVSTTGNTGITIRSGTSSHGNIYFSDGTSGSAEYRGIINYAHNIDAMLISTAGAERLRIDSSGNVGIGTTSPLAVLHLNDSANNGEGTLKIGGNTNSTTTGATFFYEISGSTFLRIKNLYRSNGSNGNNANIEYDAGFHNFLTGTGGTERMRIDANGRVIIGATSHIGGAQFVVMGGNINTYGVMAIGNKAANPTSGTFASFRFNSGATGTRRGAEINATVDGSWTDGTSHPSRLSFSTTPSGATGSAERLRIQADGDIRFQNYGTLFGQTGLTLSNTASGGPQLLISRSSGDALLLNRNTSDGEIVDLRRGWGAGGSIHVGTNSATYNTSSDYRLKENIVVISDGITRLKTLKPSRFNWIGDEGSTRDGFIAHEVTAVPEAITGTKDEVYTEDRPDVNIKAGDPKYQGIDQSKLVPLLVAAVQELITKVETLEAA